MDTENKLNELLAFILEGAKDAQAFAGEQLPLAAQEIITYGIWYNSIAAVSMFFVFLAGLLFAWKLKSCDDGDMAPAVFFVCLFDLIPLFVAAEFGLVVIKAIVAPRVYLIEYVSNLIGN